MRTKIIADVGSNHNGNLDTAFDLIDAAAEAGADVVKFQLFKADALVHRSSPYYEQITKNELPREWCEQLQERARRSGIEWTATPSDFDAVDLLQRLDVPFIKIASGDLTYRRLIWRAAKTGIPLIISAGASREQEIRDLWRALVRVVDVNQSLTLLQCNVSYPADPHDANLSVLDKWKNIPRVDFVGYSDHTLSITLPSIAVAAGARMIEKHITLDSTQKGADQGHSLNPDEFSEMVNNIRQVEVELGTGMKAVTKAETKMRSVARRGLYWTGDFDAGHTVTETDIAELRPYLGEFSAYEVDRVIGKKLVVPVLAGEHARKCDIGVEDVVYYH